MRRHVLVVEDDTDIRETLGELLEMEGYLVTLAEHGASALETLVGMRSLPDLIFLDLMMPVMDGFQFRRAQCADVRLRKIPVVVMSADPQLDVHGAVLGARSSIRKPFDIKVLLAAAAA